MKFLLQRVKSASVNVEDKTVGKIDKGLLLFVGITSRDTKEVADYLINKTINLRIFQDENDKMNLALKDINGDILVVSQFTLYADCKNGNRPSFIDAARPEEAEKLYDYIIEKFKENIKVVQTGIFGADMKVDLINDGPVTIMLEK